MPLEGRHITVPVNIRDLARAGLDRDPDAMAMASADEQVTWRELEERSDRLARNYIGLGLRAGDRVASLMPNRVALAVHYLACFRAGLVATPLNYRYSPREIDHALEVSGASVLIAHAERAADLAASDLVATLPLGVIGVEGQLDNGPTLEDLMSVDPEGTELDPSPLSDPAVIFFTSGSTGPAKGVTHTAETLGWMTASAVDALELTSDDAFLPGSSMSHLGGFLWTLASMSVGARVVVEPQQAGPPEAARAG